MTVAAKIEAGVTDGKGAQSWESFPGAVRIGAPDVDGLQLWRVDGQGFCAGFVTDQNGAVVLAAPILRRKLMAWNNRGGGGGGWGGNRGGGGGNWRGGGGGGGRGGNWRGGGGSQGGGNRGGGARNENLIRLTGLFQSQSNQKAFSGVINVNDETTQRFAAALKEQFDAGGGVRFVLYVNDRQGGPDMTLYAVPVEENPERSGGGNVQFGGGPEQGGPGPAPIAPPQTPVAPPQAQAPRGRNPLFG